MRYVFHGGTLGAFCEFIKRDKIGFIFRHQIAWWKPARKENCVAGALSHGLIGSKGWGQKNEWKVKRKSQAAGLLCLISHHTPISLPAVCPVRMAKHCCIHWQTFVCFWDSSFIRIMLSSPNISRKARAVRQEPPLFLCSDTIMPLSLILIILTKSVKKMSAAFFPPTGMCDCN